jgi:cell division protein FtsX
MDEILEKAGIPVNQIITRTQFFSGMIASMNAIVLALLIMAVLIAAVGVRLNWDDEYELMDRTREIGVMRSIGARME